MTYGILFDLEMAVGEAFDTVFDEGDVEVDKKAELFFGEFHVGEDLRGMDLDVFLNGLGFDDDAIFNEQVDAECAGESDAVIFDRDGDFPLDFQAAFFELMGRTDLVDALQQTRPERRMHLESAVNDDRTDAVQFCGNRIHIPLPNQN